jgi:hypothetical protein
MTQPGGSTYIRREADIAASESLARLADGRRADNVAAAAVVHELHRLSEIRLGEEMDIHLLGSSRDDEQPDTARARHITECEAAVALSLSRTATREMITVAGHLAWRLPAVDAAFTVGDIDYPRVRAIANTLSRASDSTVSAIEQDVLAAALRCNVRALTSSIWREWMAHDPAEATAAQKAAVTEERCADIRRGDDGIATLVAKMSMLEGAECDALLEEMAGTVCSRDPRTKKQLRGHALLALFHREESLTCTCGSDICPMAAAGALNPPRRKALLEVHIDIETLLGLGSNPATLADGTVLDPETARLLATDARWQGLLTEMLDAMNEYRAQVPNSPENNNSEAGSTGPRNTGSDSTGSDSTGSDDTEHEPSAGHGAIRPWVAKRGRARRLLSRGRRRSAAPLPTRSAASCRPEHKRGASTLGAEAALSRSIAKFLAAAASDPTLTRGRYPDGHGGFAEPPPGALTYRPSAELVALTRATYCTCTFPGCSVPAARCDIDHIVPFDHEDPQSGGWTVLDNLQPLCGYHHHAKTLRLWACAKLEGSAIYWRSSSGLHRITPPMFGTVGLPDEFVHNGRYNPAVPMHVSPAKSQSGGGPHFDSAVHEHVHTDAKTAEPSDELYEPTWWETHMSDRDTDWHRLLRNDTVGGAPSLGDIAGRVGPEDARALADAAYLRERFLEHRAIVAQREKFRPPPF